MPKHWFLLTFALMGSATACGEAAKLSELEPEIFTPSCVFAACHNTQTAAGGLSLEGSTYMALVNAAAIEAPGRIRVVPGDLATSYLMNKLDNRDLEGGGEAMPPGQPLSEERLERIRSWIEAGAAND